MSHLSLVVSFVFATLIACGGGGAKPSSGINQGMVADSGDFPVTVSNLESTAQFSWPGGLARSISITSSALRQTKEERENNAVIWGATSKAGFPSPVVLNALPPGATATKGNAAGWLGGQTFTVLVELVDGKRGSQKFVVPMKIGLGGACTADSKPAGHYGHCVFPFAGKGNLCTHYTGSAGANAKDSQHNCETLLKGTYGAGACPATTRGQCLSRCGAPNEALDTIYFGEPADWQKACDARKGTYTP